MNVITLASRKGGAGKSTLTAHLAAFGHAAGHRCLVIDADPQGSMTLRHSLRASGEPALQSTVRGIDRAIAFAAIEGYEWVYHLRGGGPTHTRCTKLSTTRFSPALSNWTVSLL